MEEETRPLLIEKEGGVATLTLNRPRFKNAVNLEMLRELDKALDDLATTPPRAVLLNATAPGFCSGVDLKESRESTPEFARE